MDVTSTAVPAPAPRTLPPWWAVLVAPFIGVGMAAVASVIIAVLSVPVTLLLTRDLYVALLAVSYGPYAAAQSLVTVVIATTIFAFAWVASLPPHRPRLKVFFSGAGGAILGVAAASLPLVGMLPYGPSFALTPLNAVIAALAGAAAGGSALRRWPQGNAIRGVRALVAPIAAFALLLALLLEVWAAATSLVG
jgi:hypothetical protein